LAVVCFRLINVAAKHDTLPAVQLFPVEPGTPPEVHGQHKYTLAPATGFYRKNTNTIGCFKKVCTPSQLEAMSEKRFDWRKYFVDPLDGES
jgi:hypothetical protein